MSPLRVSGGFRSWTGRYSDRAGALGASHQTGAARGLADVLEKAALPPGRRSPPAKAAGGVVAATLKRGGWARRSDEVLARDPGNPVEAAQRSKVCCATSAGRALSFATTRYSRPRPGLAWEARGHQLRGRRRIESASASAFRAGCRCAWCRTTAAAHRSSRRSGRGRRPPDCCGPAGCRRPTCHQPDLKSSPAGRPFGRSVCAIRTALHRLDRLRLSVTGVAGSEEAVSVARARRQARTGRAPRCGTRSAATAAGSMAAGVRPSSLARRCIHQDAA